MIPRGGNLTLNGDPGVGKLTFQDLKISNSPEVARPPLPSWGKPLIGALATVSTVQPILFIFLGNCNSRDFVLTGLGSVIAWVINE